MGSWKLWSILFLVLLCACAAPVRQARVHVPIQVEDSRQVKPVAITKVVAKIKRGDVIGELQGGLACMDQPGKLKWKSGGQVSFTTEELVDIFRDELESAGWPVVGSTDDLFSGYDYSGAEILIAAKIQEIQVNICFPMSGFGNFTDGKGEMYMKSEWQVYSSARRKIVNTFVTEGSSKVTNSNDAVVEDLLADAFAFSVRNLLANKEFLSTVSRIDSIAVPDAPVEAMLENPTYRHGEVSKAIDRAKKGTVTVRSATGHGSGFAIGDGSKVLTNAHVVGDAQNVSVVTSGGAEISVRVEKVNAERDVALLDLGENRLVSLAIDKSVPESGSEVFAVGSPLDEDLSGTVTRGIVSVRN